MNNIAQTTRELRLKRINERRAVKELNNIGKRLCWIRTKLKLLQREISQATDIPTASYNDREAGVRTDYVEEYIVLSEYFDRLWQRKYCHGSYPSYEGFEVKKITPMWLQFGTDDVERDVDFLKKQFSMMKVELEKQHYEREQNLRRQLDLFENKVS